MAINPHDIVQRIPLMPGKRTGGASGVCDTLGADWALIRIVTGSLVGTLMFGARSCSASTVLYASATQFPGGVVGISGVTRSGVTHAWLVNLRSALVSTNGTTYGGKRYIRLKTSSTTTSSVTAAIVDLKWNDLNPPTAITVASTAFVSGFASFTVIQ